MQKHCRESIGAPLSPRRQNKFGRKQFSKTPTHFQRQNPKSLKLRFILPIKLYLFKLAGGFIPTKLQINITFTTCITRLAYYSRVKFLTNVFKAKKWGKNLFPLLCAQKRREFSTSMEINSQQDNNSPQLKLPLLLA
jgi:hypothetical protein